MSEGSRRVEDDEDYGVYEVYFIQSRGVLHPPRLWTENGLPRQEFAPAAVDTFGYEVKRV